MFWCYSLSGLELLKSHKIVIIVHDHKTIEIKPVPNSIRCTRVYKVTSTEISIVISGKKSPSVNSTSTSKLALTLILSLGKHLGTRTVKWT